MSVRRLLVSYDPVAARWSFVDLNEIQTETLVAEAPGTYVERDANGTVVQLVADTHGTRELPESVLPLLREAFGGQAAAGFARRSHLDEFELSLGGDAGGSGHSVAVDLPPLPSEPGVPIRQSDGTFTISDPRGELRLVAAPGELIVTADRRNLEPGMWVVVSDSQSGVLLSTGRLEELPDGVLRARITFGLASAPERLHLLIAPHPLEPVAPRSARLASWAHQLVETSERSSRWRHRRRARAAADGLRVAQAIGDDALENRAKAAARRARRWALTTGATALILVGGGAGFAAARLMSDPAPRPLITNTPVRFDDCEAARRAGPTPLTRDQPGYRPELDRDGDGLACE